MSRWHESGCKRPDVSVVDGIPYCNHCFAILPSEEMIMRDTYLPALQVPLLTNPEQMNLAWPWDTKYVTNNCAKALQAARRQQSDRLLWVDSLCIDYEDHHERAKHTRLVNQIYTKASRVIAYVSGRHPETDMAFDFLKKLKYRALSPIDGPRTASQEVKNSLRI
jgi:Heterokaryon incompatibility protein (HET)